MKRSKSADQQLSRKKPKLTSVKGKASVSAMPRRRTWKKKPPTISAKAEVSISAMPPNRTFDDLPKELRQPIIQHALEYRTCSERKDHVYIDFEAAIRIALVSETCLLDVADVLVKEQAKVRTTLDSAVEATSGGEDEDFRETWSLWCNTRNAEGCTSTDVGHCRFHQLFEECGWEYADCVRSVSEAVWPYITSRQDVQKPSYSLILPYDELRGLLCQTLGVLRRRDDPGDTILIINFLVRKFQDTHGEFLHTKDDPRPRDWFLRMKEDLRRSRIDNGFASDKSKASISDDVKERKVQSTLGPKMPPEVTLLWSVHSDAKCKPMKAYDDLETRNHALQQQFADLEMRKEALQQRYADLETKSRVLRQQNDGLEIKNKSLQKRLDALGKKVVKMWQGYQLWRLMALLLVAILAGCFLLCRTYPHRAAGLILSLRVATVASWPLRVTAFSNRLQYCDKWGGGSQWLWHCFYKGQGPAYEIK